MCPPCKTQYGYVIKTETMNEDTSKLMETHEQLKVDLSGTIHNSTGGFGDHSTKEMVDMARNYYKNFDSEVIDRLLVIYKHDMLPFGYSFDVKSRTVGGLTV